MNKTRRILLDFEADKLYAAKLSFQRGVDGYVSFVAKTKLIDHYIHMLGAVHFGGHRMIITREASLKLIDKYFKNN